MFAGTIRYAMLRFLKLFSFFTGTAFFLAALSYFLFQAVMPEGRVFGAAYRMSLYHEMHSYQYIALIAITYGLIVTPCALRWPTLKGLRQILCILTIMIATILVASVPGGILWKIHDMQAGYFPAGAKFWNDLLWGASEGLQIGWLIIGLSIPYNIVGLILGYIITATGFRVSVKLSRT
jgi:hypothetical protein